MKRPLGISSQTLVDGSKSWRWRFKHGKKSDGRDHYVHQGGYGTMREAVDAMNLERVRLGKASRETHRDMSFGALFLEWLQFAGAEWTPKTREVNRFHANRAIERFGNVPLSKLTVEILEQEQRYLLTFGKRTKAGLGPLSGKSVKETFTLVKAALRQAKKWNRIPVDPGADLDVPTIKRKHKDILSEVELGRFLHEISSSRHYALVVFAAASGCRRGEILALRVTDVDLSTGEVRISRSLEETKLGLRLKTTKSEKPRTLTLPAWALLALKEQYSRICMERDQLSSCYQENGLFFPRRDGSYYRPDHLGEQVNDLMRSHGLSITLHGLRHLHASWMLSKGVPLPIVGQRLGHANPSITLAIYSHAMQNDDVAAAATLHEGLKYSIPERRSLRPHLVTSSDTSSRRTGTD